MKLLVTGGYFDAGGDGVIWLVDLAAARADILLRWAPPPHLWVSGKGFAGGTVAPDGTIYVAAHAALVRADPRTSEVTGVLHQPCMNDLHHVACHSERLYVSNTGLGAVDVFGLDGVFHGSHALLPAWANARRLGGEDPPVGKAPITPGWTGLPPAAWPPISHQDDYLDAARQSAPFHQLKVPDYLHVNHVSASHDRLVATCFADGSLRDLRTFERLAQVPGTFLHDGIPDGSSFWVTAIDGTLIEFDRNTFVERRRLAVFASGHWGWCRGLAVTPDHLIVGLTEVRRGRLPRHRWADLDPDGSETAVLLLDRTDGRLLARVDLTDRGRHSKLYSLLPIGGDPT